MNLNKIIIIFFIMMVPNDVFAHTNHYKNIKKIEMEIFRNNKLIGYNNYFFKRKENITEITNQIKFSVSFFKSTFVFFSKSFSLIETPSTLSKVRTFLEV